MRILVTAFEPFGGQTINPAWEAVSRLKNQYGDGNVQTRLIPTVFGEAEKAVSEAAEALGADAVLCVGQAGGRFEVGFERVAINLDDASIPDNRGNQPVDSPITESGPAAYFTNLPVKAIVEAVREAGVPAEISYSAGAFVCNHLFYKVMEEISERYPERLGGFIHLPFLPCQVVHRPHTPSMSLSDLVKALETTIRVVAGKHQ